MSKSSYTTSFSVDRTPAEVFAAINDVRGWWMTKVDGDNRAVGDEFSYRVPGVHFCAMRVTELVPGEKVVWQVVDNHMTFIDDQREWKGTEIRFELSEKDGATELRFTHDGLVPSYECFDVCRNAWSFYVGDSLRSLAATGEGKPSDPDTLSLGEEAARVG
ncbi:SRPBCC family protein [Blastococcus deserti]|uniref:SRPBCC domain-containing protein n=1 Tax=Blastococcus deserti TaxID=2259033 RepID=A0ABW4XEE7_9ACTN